MPEDAAAVNEAAVSGSAGARTGRLRQSWRLPLRSPGLPVQPSPAAGPPQQQRLVDLPFPRAREKPGSSQGAGIVDLRRSAAHPPGQRQPWWRKARASLLVIVLPTVIGAAYWGFICTPSYTAATQFSIRSEATPPQLDSLSILGLGSGGGGAGDTREILAYIPSDDLLQEVDSRLNLRAHYSRRDIDFFSRLPSSATQECFSKFWRSHVSTRFDDSTGLVRLEARAFDREFAMKIAQAILEISEDKINRLDAELVKARKRFLEGELVEAQESLRKATRSLIDFQDKHGVLDPSATAGAISQGMNNIDAELVKARTQLYELRTVRAEQSEEVKRQKARIAGLEEQAALERTRILGEGDGDIKMNSLAAQYHELMLNVTFRNDAYRTVLTAYQTATVELGHKLKHLQVVVSPRLPEEPSNPRIIYNTLSLFLIALSLWFIGVTSAAIIREHSDR